jgi:hypothetical protein
MTPLEATRFLLAQCPPVLILLKIGSTLKRQANKCVAELHSDFNYIKVRSFILNGAPFRIKQRTRMSLKLRCNSGRRLGSRRWCRGRDSAPIIFRTPISRRFVQVATPLVRMLVQLPVRMKNASPLPLQSERTRTQTKCAAHKRACSLVSLIA